MHLSIYLVAIIGFPLALLRVVESEDLKPFFFIDFIDDSFLPEPDSPKLEENNFSIETFPRDKPSKTDDVKAKKNFTPNQKVSKSNSSLKVIKDRSATVPNVGDFLLAKTENDTMYNQTGNEFLFIEDFFSIFNDSQPQEKDMTEERASFTVPTAVTDISFESPDFSGVVPLHKMYLRAIGRLVQFLMDSLFSFTESATCESSSMANDLKPHKKNQKRDLANQEDNSDASTETTNKNSATSDFESSTGITGIPSDTSQGTSLESVSTAEKDHSEETTLVGHSETSQQPSPKLTDATKLHSANMDASSDSIEHSTMTDGKQSTLEAIETLPTEPTGHKSSGRMVTRNSVRKQKLHNLPEDNLLADYIPVSFVNKKQKGVVEDQEVYDLQRTVRGSFGQSSTVDEVNAPAELFAVTVLIVVAVALLFGVTVIVFAARKTFYSAPPVAVDHAACPLSTLA